MMIKTHKETYVLLKIPKSKHMFAIIEHIGKQVFSYVFYMIFYMMF